RNKANTKFPLKEQTATRYEEGHHGRMGKIAPGQVLGVIPIIGLIIDELGNGGLYQVQHKNNGQQYNEKSGKLLSHLSDFNGPKVQRLPNQGKGTPGTSCKDKPEIRIFGLQKRSEWRTALSSYPPSMKSRTWRPLSGRSSI